MAGAITTYDGKPASAGYLIDVSATRHRLENLQESLQRYEKILDDVDVQLSEIDFDGNVTFINDAGCRIWGLPREALMGLNYRAYVHPEIAEKFIDIYKEVYRTGLPKKNLVMNLRDKDGRARTIEKSVSPIRTPDGLITGFRMVTRDITLLRDLKSELRQRNQFQNIIGRNKTMQDIYHLLEDLANLNTTVLISGESGTGKELVARALHFSGNRAFKPFITVNCSALSENLLESELFGHVKGAFTGAVQDKQGLLQAADGGTILLD
jgi:PAS domain S-box-containing protein